MDLSTFAGSKDVSKERGEPHSNFGGVLAVAVAVVVIVSLCGLVQALLFEGAF